jgi:hypothetical protein
MAGEEEIQIFAHDSGKRVVIDNSDTVCRWRGPVTIVPAWVGFAQISPFINGAPDSQQLGTISSDMLKSDRGAFVALLDRPAEVSPIVLIQHNESVFYQKEFGPRHTSSAVWRDFYFRSLYVAMKEASKRWELETISMTSLSGNAWRFDTLAVVVEVVAYLCARKEMGMSEVRVLGCEPEVVEKALEATSYERQGVDPDDLRPFEFEEVTYTSAFGTESPYTGNAGPPEGGRLFRIPMEREGLIGH